MANKGLIGKNGVWESRGWGGREVFPEVWGAIWLVIFMDKYILFKSAPIYDIKICYLTNVV